jgi:hypothetical protein
MLPIATPIASPEDRLALARAQSLPGKVMLEYLSLALFPTPEPQLLSAFAICCTRVNAYPLGERPEAVLAGLLGLGLAVRSQEGITCLAALREDVAADAVRAGRALALASFCKERKIRRRRGDGPTVLERLHTVRLVLYAVTDGDDPLDGLIDIFQAHPGILALIGRGFLDPDSLDALPRSVAFYLASETIQKGIYQAYDAPVIRRWLETTAQRVHPANEVLHGLAQMTQLLRGDLSVQQGLAESGTVLVRTLAAAVCGLPLGELSDVELSLQPWPLQRLVLAGCRTSVGLSARVRELAVRNAGLPPCFETALVRLLWTATEFPEIETDRLLLEFQWSPTWPHVCHLATGLVWSWLGLKDELPRLEEQLVAARQAYESSGYHLLAEIAREVLRRMDDEEPQSCPLLDLVRPLSQWERHLDELSRWVARRKDQLRGVVEVGEERLIWSVERRGSTLHVEPKVQKIKKTGEWSSGRAVRLLSTAHNPPEFAEAQDRRALRAAVAANATYAWDRESEDEAALIELVGHPRVVFEEKGVARHVAVVRGQPRLRIKRKGQELHLRIEPEPGKRARVKVVPEADRLTIYSLTREQDELSRLLGQGWLVVPEQREAVIREIAASAASLDIVLDSDLRLGGQEITKPADPTLRLRLAPEGRGLAGRLLVRPFGDWGPFFEPGKGGEALTAERDGVAHHAVRDLKGEKLSVKSAKAVLPQLGLTFSLETPLQSLEFLEALQEHLGEGLAVEWPEGEAFQLAGSKTLSQLALSVAPERDWFSLEGTLTIDDGEVLSLQQLLQLAQETEGRFLTLANGKYLALTQEFRTRLDQLALLTEKGAKGRLKAHPLVATLAFPDLLPADGSWSQKRRLLEQAQTLNPKLPKGLTAELRTYQKEGFTWMARLAHWEAGACLADDMGLGKTVQALAMLLQRSPLGPALVIAPTSVCANWTEESLRFAPQLRFRTLGDGDRGITVSELAPGDVVLCSYGLLVNEAERLLPVRWSTVVLDEAQYIKNSTTLRFKAAVSLQADFRLATTGTPIENHLEELWSLFAFLNPGLLGSRSSFVSRFARPIAAGDLQAKATLRRLVHPFILRRGKGEVLRELPAKTEIIHTVELHAKEMALYESLRREAVESVARSGGKLFNVLTSLTKLRRACCHPSLVYPGSMLPGSKLEAFSELVDELRSGGHRALVFSQFVDHLAIVRAHLDTRRIAYRYLDGSTPAKKRRDEVNAFQGGQGELFLISLKAGGVGLNLTAADYVIHLDPWWNPAVEDQASDRAHRMGQTRPVTVYRLVAARTIEQKIVALHNDKRDLAEKLLEGTDKATKLDVNELMALMAQA